MDPGLAIHTPDIGDLSRHLIPRPTASERRPSKVGPEVQEGYLLVDLGYFELLRKR
jgi:hypothetical protein